MKKINHYMRLAYYFFNHNRLIFKTGGQDFKIIESSFDVNCRQFKFIVFGVYVNHVQQLIMNVILGFLNYFS